MTLIGSAAIRYWYPDFPREPKDIDVLTLEEPRVVPGNDIARPIEYHRIRPLHLWADSDQEALGPQELYTLKLSHIFWDIKWEKHMFDIVWLKRKGCHLIPSLFRQLYAFWVTKRGEPPRANLNMSKAEFFDNALKNQDRHDLLHAVLKNQPTYTKILVGEVATSDVLFSQLSHEDKLSLIEEETCVMAYERLAGRDWRSAYIAQLKQMILHHLPFEQAIFAADNYYELRLPKRNYKEVLDEVR